MAVARHPLLTLFALALALAPAAHARRGAAPTPAAAPAATYSTALVDLIVSLTQSRVADAAGAAVAAGVKACVDAELPRDSAIFADFQGMRARERAAAFVARTLTQTHPDTAGFVACVLRGNLASRAMLRADDNSAALLGAAASLVGVTPDPTLLLSALLEAGARADAPGAADAAGAGRGQTLLHRAYSCARPCSCCWDSALRSSCGNVRVSRRVPRAHAAGACGRARSRRSSPTRTGRATVTACSRRRGTAARARTSTCPARAPRSFSQRRQQGCRPRRCSTSPSYWALRAASS
jgi:hypothetical protein